MAIDNISHIFAKPNKSITTRSSEYAFPRIPPDTLLDLMIFHASVSSAYLRYPPSNLKFYVVVLVFYPIVFPKSNIVKKELKKKVIKYTPSCLVENFLCAILRDLTVSITERSKLTDVSAAVEVNSINSIIYTHFVFHYLFGTTVRFFFRSACVLDLALQARVLLSRKKFLSFTSHIS